MANCNLCWYDGSGSPRYQQRRGASHDYDYRERSCARATLGSENSDLLDVVGEMSFPSARQTPKPCGPRDDRFEARTI